MRTTGIVPALHQAPLRDAGGAPVGAVEDLLADAATNRPAWLAVRLTDGRRTVVPWRGSHPGHDGIRVPWEGAVVRTCPATLSGPTLEREHVVSVCHHYGLLLPHVAWTGAFVAVRATGAQSPRGARPAVAA